MHRDKSQQGESGTVRGDAQIHDSSQAARPIETEMNGFPPTPTACHAPDVIAPSAYIVLLVRYISTHSGHVYLTTSLACSRLWLPFVLHFVLSGRCFFLFLGTMPSHSGVHFNSLVVFFQKKE